jgi:hypothetical protein
MVSGNRTEAFAKKNGLVDFTTSAWSPDLLTSEESGRWCGQGEQPWDSSAAEIMYMDEALPMSFRPSN